MGITDVAIDLCASPSTHPAPGSGTQTRGDVTEFFNGFTRTTHATGRQQNVADAWDENCTGPEAWLWDEQVETCLEMVRQRQAGRVTVTITCPMVDTLLINNLENLGMNQTQQRRAATCTTLRDAAAQNVPERASFTAHGPQWTLENPNSRHAQQGTGAVRLDDTRWMAQAP